MAEQNSVGVGAHPSFPDLNGFGRRSMDLSAEEVKSDLIYQIGALKAFTKNNKLQHVKPHGALYNQAVNDEPLARSICEAVLEIDSDMILVALSGSRWVDIANEMGLNVAREIFADRALNNDGTLVSRSQPGAVLHDVNEVVDRSIRMVTEGIAVTADGVEIEVNAESICVHGDTKGAVDMARELRIGFEEAKVKLVSLGELV
jgi:UPF0271 protein